MKLNVLHFFWRFIWQSMSGRGFSSQIRLLQEPQNYMSTFTVNYKPLCETDRLDYVGQCYKTT